MQFVSLVHVAMLALGSVAAAVPLDSRDVAVVPQGKFLRADEAPERRDESDLEARGLSPPFQTTGTGWSGHKYLQSDFKLNTCYQSPYDAEHGVNFWHNTRSFGPGKGYQCALYSGTNNCDNNNKIYDHLGYPGKDNFGNLNAHWGYYYCWAV